MYKGHSLWDQEQDKYDGPIDKEEGPGYKNQANYDASDEQSDVYNSQKTDEENKKKDEEKGIEKELAKEEKKYESKEASEEDVKKKAASDVFEEKKRGIDKKGKNKKAHKSIEDAINKAIKEEKELIYMDD